MRVSAPSNSSPSNLCELRIFYKCRIASRHSHFDHRLTQAGKHNSKRRHGPQRLSPPQHLAS